MGYLGPPGKGTAGHGTRIPRLPALLALGALLALADGAAAAGSPSPARPTHASTVVFDAARSRAWCVNADNNSVSAFDASTLARLKEIPVGRRPRTLALDSLGRVWVANQDDATLTVLDGGDFSTLGAVALPRASRPHGICFDPAGGTAYVTLEAVGALIRVDAASRAVTGRLDLFPKPRGIAVTGDGERVLVTRFISPADRGEVADVRARPFALAGIIPLPYDTHEDNVSEGSGVPNALASITISPDGRRAWVPFKKDNVRRGLFVDPAREAPDFESTVRTAVGQLLLDGNREDYAARKDLDNGSMASAVAFDSLGAIAFLSALTSNRTVAVHAATGEEAAIIDPVADSAGPHPHGLAPDGLAMGPGDSLLFVHYSMSRQLGAYDVSRARVSNQIPLLALLPTVEREALAPEVLRGKQIFHNAADIRMSRDRYLSCAACHLDGAADGRVWDFTHKGEGLRRTISLLGRSGMGHGPLHWSGNFDEVQDFEHDIRGSFSGIGLMTDGEFFSAGRDAPLGGRKAGVSADLDALAAYVSSLSRANPSPYRNADGALSPDARAGRAIFNREETGCAACHAPPRYTDSDLGGASGGEGAGARPTAFLLHDVGTLKPGSGKRLNDTLRGLDTPTLLGLWEAGPYLHDGSAPTLMDVITTANPDDRHGKTSHLTAREKEQLVAFLREIDGGPEEEAGVARPRAMQATPHGRVILRALGGGWEIRWHAPGAGDGETGMGEAGAGRGTRLRVFDSRGRLIAALRPEPMSGTARGLAFRWMNGDSRGNGPRAGIYVFRLEWPGGSAAQRVLMQDWKR